jgi:DmsE family decaheme c-type cytochrome
MRGGRQACLATCSLPQLFFSRSAKRRHKATSPLSRTNPFNTWDRKSAKAVMKISIRPSSPKTRIASCRPIRNISTWTMLANRAMVRPASILKLSLLPISSNRQSWRLSRLTASVSAVIRISPPTGRLTSSHAKNQVSCTACHKMHGTSEQLVARQATDINEQCSGCHTDVWANFQRQYRHRLPEGAMSCVDCHNPHGSVLPYGMLQTFRGNEPGCFNCHGDLAAPFVYEHSPVRLEGCMACHQPHGSANPRMLTRGQVQYVCLECHANLPTLPPNATAFGPLGTVPPAFHDLRSPRFQNCTTCHQKIHGSYVNPELLR